MTIDFHKLREERKIGEVPEWRQEFDTEEKLREQTACFTGHRPQHLFGFNLKDERYKPLYKSLSNAIEQCIIEENIINFISGGALGCDTIAFWLVHKLKEKYPYIKNIVAVPFKKQDSVWTQEQKQWYKRMLDKADETIYVDELDRYKINEVAIGEYHIEKMSKRNKYMVDKSKIVISVFNGSPGGTKNCIFYANKMYRTIYRIYPDHNFELNIRRGILG